MTSGHRLKTTTSALGLILGVQTTELDRLISLGDRAYQHRRIPKAHGGSRPVDAPIEALKRVQRQILYRVLRKVPAHESSYCVQGRGIVRNAKRHLGRRWVYTFDIATAYVCTRRRAVRSALQRALRATTFDHELAEAIVRLCMLRDSLPQGAPTSAALLDIALGRTDESLAHLAAEAGGRYSRYADDLTLSFSTHQRKLVNSVAEAVGLAGLRLNHDKSQQWRPGEPATVTSLILRRRVGLDRTFLCRARAGLELAETDPTSLSEKHWDSLRALISYIKSVQPKVGERLRRRFTGALRQ